MAGKIRPNARSGQSKRIQVKRKEQEQIRFLQALRERGIVEYACSAVGINKASVYNWRDSDPTFAAEWDEALDIAVERMESEAVRRGVEGTLKPVFQQGACVGYIREYSDTLLIFILKARKPKVYRDNVAVEHTGKDGNPIKLDTTTRIIIGPPEDDDTDNNSDNDDDTTGDKPD